MAGGGKGVSGVQQALPQLQGLGSSPLGGSGYLGAGAQAFQQGMAQPQQPAWLQALLQHQAGQPIMQGLAGNSQQGHQPIVQSLMSLMGGSSAPGKSGIIGGLMGLL